MTEHKFKVGDKVQSFSEDCTAGLVGKIFCHPEDEMPGVDFGPGFSGHSLDGSLKSSTGYWVLAKDLQPATAPAVEPAIAEFATAESLNALAAHIHELNRKWWVSLETGEPIERNKGELLCLIHSEISEAMEGERKNLQDDKLPHRKMAEVELADAIIRILDYGAGFGYDIGGALFEKLEYNKTRADHSHEARKAANGKKF